MLLNMVQHSKLRGSLAAKIKPQIVRNTSQLLKYEAFGALKSFHAIALMKQAASPPWRAFTGLKILAIAHKTSIESAVGATRA
jgi:hypothetical protein